MSHWGLWRRWEPAEGYLALRPAFFFIDSRSRRSRPRELLLVAAGGMA